MMLSCGPDMLTSSGAWGAVGDQVGKQQNGGETRWPKVGPVASDFC